MMAYLEDYGQILFLPDTEGKELVDHLRAMERMFCGLSASTTWLSSYARSLQIPRSDFHLYSIVILIQFSSTLLCILILSRCDLHFSFSVHRLSHGMSSLVPIGDVRGLILIWGCLWIELLSDSDLLMAGHRTDYCASLRHTIQDLIDSGEHIEIRLLQLRFTMSDEIAPITLTTLYEMMVDLTRRVERIEHFVRASIVIERSSRSSDAFIATLDFIDTCYFGCLTSTTSPTFSVPAAFLIHFTGYADTTSAQFRGPPAMGFLAPLAPRALPDPVPPQFRLDLYCAYHQSVGHHTDRCTALRHAIQDIVDSGTFGHPQSICPIPTSAQAMHADTPSPAVPDLIDLGD
ncbi:hypothetical protein CK203_114915 [Vitis vinifera]|uniref:Uncharacterized protein n=1 Tax=Vitis vinifera TaxID=29760 RepID=A0A438C4U3_VITVI|nr:hypothetical protein CK203_114915 [Vitis vinifera]